MSWKERRLITILSMILLVLFIALVLVLAGRYRDKLNIDEPADEPSTGLVTDHEEFTSLTYDNGETTLSFERDETGIWCWTADRDLPLDDSVILDILGLLTNWTPQQILTDSAALEESGLAEPTGSLTAVTDMGIYTKVLFGKTTTDGTSDYVRLNDDESTVYIIDGALSDLMEIPVYDMCRLPNLPVLEESRIRSIIIRGAAQEDGSAGLTTSLSAQTMEGDTNTSWRSEGANVTDDPTVRALLEDLTALTFNKCIDYNPSDEAAVICGFDAPSAMVQISYVTEGGAEQSLELIIGNRLPDKSGRYTRMGDDSSIYLMVTDLLDPLMSIAAGGLY